MSRQAKQISQPDLIDALTELKLDIFYNFNCHKIGIINSFNSSNQTATIELVDKRVFETSEGQQLKDYPPLIDVPIIINKGETGGFTRPINQGDFCLVLFNDRNLDNWYINGTVSAPINDKTHDLGDGIALVGLFPTSSSIADYNNEATEINYEATKISLDSKVGISNSTQSLQDLISQLIDALVALQVLDPVSGNLSITTSTANTLTQLQNDFNQLLKT